MIILKHRVNSINDYDTKYGVEIDIRDFNNKLVLSHNPPNENSFKLE